MSTPNGYHLPTPFIFGLMSDLSFVVGEAVYPAAAAFLPITGSHIGQLGVCLVLATIICEIRDRF